MSLLNCKTTKDKMLATLAICRDEMEKKPASKFVITMYDILVRFEAAYADGREPSDQELRDHMEEITLALEDFLECQTSQKS